MSARKLSKKQQLILKGQTQGIETTTIKSHFRMSDLEAKTDNQEKAIRYYDEGYELFLGGIAGTGKTYVALALGIQDVIEGDTPQKKVVIVRSVVPTRDMGYLPGSEEDKTAVYEAPYKNICQELFGRGDAYEILKNKGLVEFITTSFIRGTTINDAIVIVDEVQNLTAHEAHTVITRIGKNCRVIFCGDLKQSDINKRKEMSGFSDFLRVLQSMDDFKIVMFEKEDIVRSGLVKSYIITRDRLEEEGKVSSLV